MKPRRIAILGSTGSIGRQALEVIADQSDLSACALAAGANAALLAEQVRTFSPEYVALAETSGSDELREAIASGSQLFTGPDAMVKMVRAARPDVLLSGVVGTSGVAPTLAGIECGSALAIANKETLVMAGAIVMPAARAAGVEVLPVDSEHSGVFQCISAGRRDEVRRVTLTASGGALRDWSDLSAHDATVQDALEHPTWDMGPKVTIDSATMMNKAMEIIEAHWLFDLQPEQIDVVIHPQSIVHAYVEFCDGSVVAQLARPDMKVPISYALCFPRRAERRTETLDLASLGELTFRPLAGRFRMAVELAYQVIRRGGTAGAVMNSANEAAVEAFLAGRIRLGEVVPLVEKILDRREPVDEVSLDALFAAEAYARDAVTRELETRKQ